MGKKLEQEGVNVRQVKLRGMALLNTRALTKGMAWPSDASATAPGAAGNTVD
jgi:hypothetical protein